MAFKTHSGSIAQDPTPTAMNPSTATSSTEQATSSPDPSPGLSSSASPPLILAFLAIGLFSAAMILVFGWRRFQIVRGMVVMRGPEGAPDDGYGDYGMATYGTMLKKRPKLWDLWNGNHFLRWDNYKSSEIVEVKGRWADVMPLSAQIVVDDPAEQMEQNDKLNLNDGRATAPIQHFHVNMLRTPGRGMSSVWPVAPSTKASRDRENNEKPPPQPEPSTKLQVAVVVLMPSMRHPVFFHPREQNDVHEEKDDEGSRIELTDYSIGIHERIWQK